MKKIPGYPRQALSPDGTLYRDGEPAEVFIGLDGYRQAWIYRGKKQLRHPKKIYQLMAKTYLGPKPGKGYLVRHLDGNCHNDSAENLCWGTHAENMEDLRKHNAGRSSLTNGLKKQIAFDINRERPFTDNDHRVRVLVILAEKHKVSFLTVNRVEIVTRKEAT